MARHDVVIYAPGANVYYDAVATAGGGGMERQTFLIAQALAAQGLRVAHLVWPVAEPVETAVTLGELPVPGAYGTGRAFVQRLGDVWSALEAADARVQIFRGAQGNLGVAGAWARRRGRKLIFSSANESDFGGGSFDGPRDPRALLYAAGVRLTHAIVVQTAGQEELCRERFPKAPAPRRIRSFVEPQPAATAPGEAFLWVSRLTEYKRPQLYADLAEAVPEATFWMIASDGGAPSAAHDEVLAALQRRAAGLPNLEILPQRPHAELQALMGRAVAMVNTSSFEGVPNTWLEGWARGIPALTFSFDPDGRIAAHGLGVCAGGSAAAFAEAARRLWAGRADRGAYGPTVRAYVADVHGDQVAAAWRATVDELLR